MGQFFESKYTKIIIEIFQDIIKGPSMAITREGPSMRQIGELLEALRPLYYVWFLLIVTLFTLGNFSDVYLALRAHDVGMDISLIPLAFFAFNLISSLFLMPIGMLSDRTGRRSISTKTSKK
jgi:hypothetical protein